MRRALLLALGFVSAAPASAQTLREAIAQAYETNPELAAARARQEALEELPEQARASGRLSADAIGNGGYDRFGGGSSAFGTVTTTLPIWTGGRVRSAVRAATRDVAAGAEGLRDIEAAVLQDVVSAYANLLFNQQFVEVARVGIERLDGQVAETRSRFGLGLSTRTDVAQLEAQRASVVANLAEAEGALATAAAAFRALVGQDAVDLSPDVPSPAALPATLTSAREQADANSPLLLRQRRIAEASAARVDQARADGAPSFDLTGSYGRGGQFVGRDVQGFTAATSAGVTLRVPLLTGGLVPSRIREAQSIARAERLQVDAEQREARRTTDAAWASLVAAQQRLRVVGDGLGAAELALQGVRAEYGFGLRSTIDILIADQSYRAAQLSLASARADVLMAQANLLRVIGKLDAAAYN